MILAITNTGIKLPPLLIVKTPSCKNSYLDSLFEEYLLLRQTSSEFINEFVLKYYMERIILHLSIPEDEQLYLVMDRYRVHTKASIQQLLKTSQLPFTLILAGGTAFVQPLDVFLNKPLKDGIRVYFKEWFREYGQQEENITDSGYIRLPHRDLLAKWVLEAWNDLDKDLVIKSFKGCGKICVFFYD